MVEFNLNENERSDPKICNYPLHVNSIEMRIYRVLWLFIMIDFNSSKKLLNNITNSKNFFLTLCMYCVRFTMYQLIEAVYQTIS